MKALNRQQRKAAIWKFVILYFITVLLILIPFIFMGKFSDYQSEKSKSEGNKAQKDLIKCQNDLNQLKLANADLKDKLSAKANENNDLSKQLSDCQAGFTSRSSSTQASTQTSSTTPIGNIQTSYVAIERGISEELFTMKSITKDGINGLNESKFDKLKKCISNVTTYQTNLSKLNSELAGLSKK